MKHIIVVDDDPGVQVAFTMIFDPKQYKVAVFGNGQAIMNNKFELPDLFILDKQLSGIDGLDICRFLKSQPSTKNIPVLILSASPEAKPLAELAGADGFVEKPFSIVELRKVVMNYVK